MDNSIAAGLLGAAAAIIGGIIAGIFTLKGAEHALTGSLKIIDEQRIQVYQASRHAAEREMQLNLELLGEVQDLLVWLPLRHSALDNLLANPHQLFPEPVLEATATLQRYNALAEMSEQIFQSGQPVPPALQLHLKALSDPDPAKGLRLQLNEAISCLQAMAETPSYLRRTR